MSLNRLAGRYASMLGNWRRMLFGKSYWHTSPGLGRHFVAGALEGYFRDYSGKVQWQGPVDVAGMPLVRIGGGRQVVFPTTVFQKALGHWDAWIESGRSDAAQQKAFLAAVRWAVSAQDERGGWPCWSVLGLRRPSDYSAMTQGQGISVLVRAGGVTADAVFLESARRALGPMLAPVAEAGCARWEPAGLVLEETPCDPPNTILNGWIYALFGLYDLLLAVPVEEARQALESTVEALAACLPRFDAGYWSYYDTAGNLASPYYHEAHIGQLRALEMVFPGHAVFHEMRAVFERQAASRLNRLRAVCRKAIQKLMNPPEEIFR